jgi:hypothetical protein
LGGVAVIGVQKFAKSGFNTTERGKAAGKRARGL